jgi:hypothetical protein
VKGAVNKKRTLRRKESISISHSKIAKDLLLLLSWISCSFEGLEFGNWDGKKVCILAIQQHPKKRTGLQKNKNKIRRC